MRCVVPYSDTLITGPTVEPLDLEEVKKHLKFAPTTEDTLLDAMISAARQSFELETGRQAMDATRERVWRGTVQQCELELPYPPLIEVVSLTYDDSNGDAQDVDADTYEVIANNNGPTAPPARLRLLNGTLWPTTTALRCRYRCGYGASTGAVPELVKAAMYLLVAALHRERSALREGNISEVPIGAAILRHFKYTALPVLGDVQGLPANWTGPWS